MFGPLTGLSNVTRVLVWLRVVLMWLCVVPIWSFATIGSDTGSETDNAGDKSKVTFLTLVHGAFTFQLAYAIIQ